VECDIEDVTAQAFEFEPKTAQSVAALARVLLAASGGHAQYA
jgi:hypothetical protein